MRVEIVSIAPQHRLISVRKQKLDFSQTIGQVWPIALVEFRQHHCILELVKLRRVSVELENIVSGSNENEVFPENNVAKLWTYVWIVMVLAIHVEKPLFLSNIVG